MQTRIAQAGLVLAGGVAAAAHAGTIDRDLADAMAVAGAGESISVLAYLDVQLDIETLKADFDAARLPLADRHRITVSGLRGIAEETQGGLLAWLDARADRIERLDVYWVVNAIRIDAPAELLTELARRPEIGTVYLNYPIENVTPTPGPGDGQNEDASLLTSVPEPGLAAIKAPDAWALGFDGTGTLVANIDTGVRGSHVSLASRWAGTLPDYVGHPEWAWLDPYLNNNTFPYDDGGHGTHTMGTICGGAPGDQIGVAPGSHWIAAGAIDRGGGISGTVADAIESFQWVIDPDGNPNTHWDVPDVVSNSWGLLTAHGYSPCDQTFWSFLDACETAGIVVVFAAGNEGANGLRRPADRATDAYRQFAVAAVDGNSASFPIASFSSLGPTNCTPSGASAIKPDIAAPGVSVRSAYNSSNTAYTNLSGTSMATPHIAGVVALVRQAAPDMPPDVIKQVIYDTAQDLGAAGEDNTFGHGITNALAAVQAALDYEWISFDAVSVLPSVVDPNGGTSVTLAIEGNPSGPVAGTALAWISENGGAYAPYPMTETGPGVFDVAFPGFACQAEVSYYFSAQSEGGATFTFPPGAPGSHFEALAYTQEVVLLDETFQSDAGWTVSNVDLLDGPWERAVPAGGGDRGDPPTDYDGSGACWVTDNEDGNSDVDGGPTTVTSTIFDATGTPDPVLSYARWFTNDDGDGDRLTVELSNNGGSTWTVVEQVANLGTWQVKSVRILDLMTPTAQMRIRFSATDNPNDSVTEAAFDALRISAFVCDDPSVPGDVNGDGVVNFDDLLALLSAWGPCGASCAGDFDGDGSINFADLLIVLSNWS